MVRLEFEGLRAAVHTTLVNAHVFDWTVQGFGFLRTYFGADKTWRLNVWDSRLTVAGVSIIHDHPWDFESIIITGRFQNIRYLEDEDGQIFQWMEIKTGEGGGPTGDDYEIRLSPRPCETYGPGDSYDQNADEIHASFYQDGTVTLNKRTPRGDGEHARVFWPTGKWVDAEPRPATPDEIAMVAAGALNNFTGE